MKGCNGALGLVADMISLNKGNKYPLLEVLAIEKRAACRISKWFLGTLLCTGNDETSFSLEIGKEKRYLVININKWYENQVFIICNHNFNIRLYFKNGLSTYGFFMQKMTSDQTNCYSRSEDQNFGPKIKPDKLLAGLILQNRQFDSTRRAYHLPQTGGQQMAIVIKYSLFIAFEKENKVELN
jgi:glycerol-3-phosphate dehydrogenase